MAKHCWVCGSSLRRPILVHVSGAQVYAFFGPNTTYITYGRATRQTPEQQVWVRSSPPSHFYLVTHVVTCDQQLIEQYQYQLLVYYASASNLPHPHWWADNNIRQWGWNPFSTACSTSVLLIQRARLVNFNNGVSTCVHRVTAVESICQIA